ncbi:MAG: TRAP transporter substrate-binding protein [Marinobacterium sp.]|nr:TRAP transporter substrate-binding protein [Marinobacterium sp.]
MRPATITTALLSTLLVALPSQAATTLRVASWLSPNHPQNAEVWPTWAGWVEEATEGRVKVVVEYGLGHPKTMFELVEDGVVDASFSYHGYVPGRFKLTQAVEQPGLGASAEAASVAHWRIYERYFAKAQEHDGLEVIGLFTHSQGQLHTTKPVKSLADLEGRKLRLGGGVQGELGHRLGVTPVGAPAPKVYEMMQQGVIDGYLLSMIEHRYMRLSEVTPYVVRFPQGMYMGSFGIFMNPDFLDGLSEADRKAILSVSGEKLSAMAGRAWDRGNAEGLEAARAAGVNILDVKPDEPLAKAFDDLTADMDQRFLKIVERRGVDAEKALAELRQIARDYQPAK